MGVSMAVTPSMVRRVLNVFNFGYAGGNVRYEVNYTPNSLKDLCGNELLDINRSPLIKNTFNYLDSLARTNNFSRIIASGFIDRYCL